jgi:hypothetical protein
MVNPSELRSSRSAAPNEQDRMKERGPLWRCPRCGHRFASRHLWHSCGNYRLAEHFTKRPAALRLLFNRWRAMARACGPVTVYAQKTRIVFQAGVRFAGAVVHADWLEATLWLRRRATHRCVYRVESLGQQGYGLHLRLVDQADLDDGLNILIREAYAEHATARTRGQRVPGRRVPPSAPGAAARRRGTG